MVVAGLLIAPPAPAQSDHDTLLRAFPGAEGFGACTPGGRGGTVHYVTTLEDYAPGEPPIPGTLRAAIDSEGPRIVLFQVGGTITLKADLWVRNPFITIAGQTAPGGGICIKDFQFVLATNDIIIRHMRFRSGDETRKEQMAVGIFGASNCILDHCSMSWAIDEVMSSFGAKNITVQWSIIAEGLSHSFHPKGEHSKGSIIDGTGGITIHHSLYAHNAARNPRVNTVMFDFRNNVLYNWGYRAAYTTEAPSYVNWVGNYLKPGPSTRKSARSKIFDPGDDMPRVFVRDNVVDGNPELTANNTLLIEPLEHAEPAEFRTMMAIDKAFDAPPVTMHRAEEALSLVIAQGGATLPARDPADTRLMREVQDGTGKIIDSPAEVGGWPELATGTPVADTDADGMPDSWEHAHGFDPDYGEDGKADADDDGYTNIEEYINATNPRKPEKDCRVPAAPFRRMLADAERLSADGLNEFRQRESAANEASRTRHEAHAKSLTVSITPPDDPAAPRVTIAFNGKPTLEFVRIPAGSFTMGTPEHEGGLDRERPQHTVTISKPFYLCITKTTNAQFLALFGSDARDVDADEMEFPAKEVNWFEAVEYCELLSTITGRTFRLPTEAEWEYACRAGTTTAFYTGETITSDQANFDASVESPFNPRGINRGALTPVKMFPPNPWGLYDMLGNQAEYCQDLCFRTYTADTITDPIAPGSLDSKADGARVLRGGKATSKAYYLRAGYRYGYAPGVGYGFRVLLETTK